MNKKLSIIPITISVIIMIAIFISSAQTRDESYEVSSGIAQFVAKIVIFEYDNMSLQEQNAVIDAIYPFLRKATHFAIYALLGFTVFLSVHFYIKRMRMQVLTAFLICAAYACSDEIHQYFVPGRYALVSDVLIDTAGALLGIAAGVCVVAIVFWRKNR